MSKNIVIDVSAQSRISELISAFHQLKQTPNTDDLSVLHAEKLQIIRAFEMMINEHRSVHLQPTSIDETNENAFFLQTCRKLCYQFLLTVGLFQDALGNYLFWETLFLLIPRVIHPVVIALSFVSTALSCVLYYAFQVAYLKDAFDLPEEHTTTALLLDSYSLQLETTIAINESLSSLWMLSVDNDLYGQYVEFAALLNQELRDINTSMPLYQETAMKQTLKTATIGFGALASIASSYFTATLLMGLLAASIIGTPLGWGLIVLCIVADLGYYYALGASSMANLINPDTERYQSVKTNLIAFDATYRDDLKSVCALKQSYTASFFKQQTADAQSSEIVLTKQLGVMV